MPGPDRSAPTVAQLAGHRIVADPTVLDALVAAFPPSVTSIRFALDEAFVVGASSIAIDDPDAIVEEEAALVAIIVDRAVVERHTEWPLPPTGEIGQGAIAGVPAKLAWLPDGRAWIITQAAYVADLLDRLT